MLEFAAVTLHEETGEVFGNHLLLGQVVHSEECGQ